VTYTFKQQFRVQFYGTITTFNQLLKIAQKVLDYLEGALRPNSQSTAQTLSEQSTEEDDFPF
jgi:hypothetical protein